MKAKRTLLLLGIMVGLLAGGGVAAPPQIQPATTLQHQAACLGALASFTASATGSPPLSYQWQRDGQNLLGQTNRSLRLYGLRPVDGGDYTVVVANTEGVAISEPARLWVVPPATNFVRGDFTNEAGLRLPYFLFTPPVFEPGRLYPLICLFHGLGGDETTVPAFLADNPFTAVFACYAQQTNDPALVLWPSRRWGDSTWTDSYLRLVSGLLNQLMATFPIDINRLYVGGGSEGGHAAWDLIGMRPGVFAGAAIAAGGPGNTPASIVKVVPLWAWYAADDPGGNMTSTVRSLRAAGGNPLYTVYRIGGHMNGIGMNLMTPAFVDWMLAQRRGVRWSGQPRLSIGSPTSESALATAAPIIDLAGSAQALGQPITQVVWTNLANHTGGVAAGTNLWTVSGVPLVAGQTNLVIVTATTTSWAPGYGGNTTFSDSLAIFSAPLRVNLALQNGQLILNWTGGAPPYAIQQATDLVRGQWTDLLTNAIPPVTLPFTRMAEFFRIVGR